MKKITIVKKTHPVPTTVQALLEGLGANLAGLQIDKIQKIMITAEETKIHKVSEI